ncbi:BadF/BadG/BcrA/BcrD ATPase family protein [Streptomyces roseicoloratus]|uniref:BadF/BadG/BcrA/BcrD ATPase family protein n=1 Tax=Streptomyces roseicoloratus TaxID=2508722 RepID=A0ABY9S1C6_9ACTN|nr:BadF/BadG/BcrA/BcrD ATPase family protein [Streptomyces roseicoloratus]WMX48232.1 BadF/BadG/BcrA/BcrD ATPase family protein [Streptomyces roseicoloratus]
MTAAPERAFVVGVDSGGSGLRVALARPGRGPAGEVRIVETVSSPEPVPTGSGGIDAGHLLGRLLPAVDAMTERAGGGAVLAVAVGAAGMTTLGDRLRAELPGAFDRAWGVRRFALAADAVTAYAGALGQRPGAVVAGGTGLIAIGTDLSGWRRADGWGHLLGDCGSGAWIGRAGLEAAMRAYDGRRGGSAALLARAEERFGPVAGLPGALYPRTDRPAVLASFAPEVAACAAAGDAVAVGVLEHAAAHIAEAAAAVVPSGPGAEVALTGGLFRMGEPLLGPLRAEFGALLPDVRDVPAAGEPLTGAVTIAAALADGSLRLPEDPRLLHITR